MSPKNFLVDLTVYNEEIKNVKYIKKTVHLSAIMHRN